MKKGRKKGSSMLIHRKSTGYVKQPTVERIHELLECDYMDDVEIRIFASDFVNWFTALYGCSMVSAYRMVRNLERVYNYNFIRRIIH